MITRNLITVLGSMWLFIEIGQSLRRAVPDWIGNNPLYWYLWCTISMVIVLIAHALDNYFGL
ncbi:MAG: hypothetical protein AAF902_13100 [Chloroflexota bacterium]